MRRQTDEALKDWLAAGWFAPFTLGITIFECMATLTDSCIQAMFCPKSLHEPEKHTDLEVPEPIEETGESELFA